MGNSLLWDSQEYSSYEQKVTRRLGIGRFLALSLFLMGVAVTGWQTLAFAFHAEAQPHSKNLSNLHQLEATLPSSHAAPKELSSNPMSVESIKRELNDPMGRPDPFSPLVKEIDPTVQAVDKTPEVQRDVLQDVSYTGFIGDKSSAGKVAILHITDPNGNVESTVIKKVGESFLVEGQSAILRSIDSSGVRVHMAGNTRFLSLQSFQAVPQTAGAAGSANPTSFGGPPPNMNKTRIPGAGGMMGEGSSIPGGTGLQGLSE
jgi:hypothetical protein